jgi:NADH-quinone oxidoreductase subunit M
MITAAILVPFFAALVILLLKDESAKPGLKSRNAWLAVTATAASLVSAVLMVKRFAPTYGEAQLRETWWTATGTGINITFAVDGLSFPLFIAAAFLFFIAALFSMNAFQLQTATPPARQKIFWGMFLLLESVVLAIFSAWNFIAFFAFWELFLIPLTILLWRFGLEERRRAALQFFIYTFVSSAFMVAAFAAIVYYAPRIGGDFDFRSSFAAEINMMAPEKQRLLFLFFMAAFLVKMPVFPLHAWLPLTHTQAPLGTLLLSGLFLKLGSYGILRFVTPNFSGVLTEWGTVFTVVGLVSMFYGAFAAYRQKSFRYVIAYSSLAHMGMLLVGTLTRHEYATSGAIIQNVGHSLANAMLFIIVCMHLVRGKSDSVADINPPKSFVYWAAFSLALFSAIGVPGTIGFVGEFMMLFGLSFKSWPLTILAVLTLVLSAAYMLRLFHKVRGRAADTSWRPTALERTCLVLISAAILWFGIYPSFLGESARATAKTFNVNLINAPAPETKHR